jgi:hypothetical protein
LKTKKSRATRIIITICAKSIAKGHQNCVSWKIKSFHEPFPVSETIRFFLPSSSFP